MEVNTLVCDIVISVIEHLWAFVKWSSSWNVDGSLHFFQTDKKSQEIKEKPAIEENAFEALERDFQEVRDCWFY